MKNIALILFSSVLFIACESKPKSKLPYIGNFDIAFKKVNGKTVVDTLYPTIPTFSYRNEDSVLVSNKNFKDKIWIVEFFFATCPTICPIMNSQLKKLNKETDALNKYIQFISFTINPNNDRPSVLKSYKNKYGIAAKNWSFLTGDEVETHRLGIENFQTFAGRDDEAEGGYAHSGAFTLVDKKGYVRGVYAVTGYDGIVNKKEYERLKEDIFKLLKDEYNITTP